MAGGKSHREANRRWYQAHKKQHIERVNQKRDERRKQKKQEAAKKTDQQMDEEALRWVEGL